MGFMYDETPSELLLEWETDLTQAEQAALTALGWSKDTWDGRTSFQGGEKEGPELHGSYLGHRCRAWLYLYNMFRNKC